MFSIARAPRPDHRILAIRGANLASLAAPFEVDLTAEPLAGSSLFAITGETGSGKPDRSCATDIAIAKPSGSSDKAEKLRNYIPVIGI